jgi:hypothetical protein
MPDSITAAMDHDERTKIRRPASDKLTGRPVWQRRVSDMDPEPLNSGGTSARSSRGSSVDSVARPVSLAIARRVKW